MPTLRIMVVIGGAALMVAAAFAGLGAANWIADTWPWLEPGGRASLVVLFLPATALITLAAAALWARLLRPSRSEGIGSLLIVEVVAWGIVVSFAGEWFTEFVGIFWIGANLFFLPWWLLGLRLGGRHTR